MNKSPIKSTQNPSEEDPPVVLRINRLNSAGAEQLHGYPRPLPTTTVPLSKLSSKSEDSIDSGIYSRQKSVDSMDSLDSNEGSFNGEHAHAHKGGLSPSEEALPSMPSQYEDYLRECQDIRQSIIVIPEEEKQTVTRTDSGDDENDDNEADWLRLAGLSDLVVNSDSAPTGQPAKVSARISTDSLSSMTVLSTLTRPQREAVLRRITSFNRAQKSRRRPKPTINTIFPTLDSPKSPQTTSPTFPSLSRESKVSEETAAKSTSLPRNVMGFGDGGYQRRYSETPRREKDLDSPIRSSPLSPTESKTDYRFKHKKSVTSIVATEASAASDVTKPQGTAANSGNVPGYVISSCMNKILVNSKTTITSMYTSLPDLSQIDSDPTTDVTLRNEIPLSKLAIKSDYRSSPAKRCTDRSIKALSDVPNTAVIHTPDSPARLNLQDNDKNVTKEDTLTATNIGITFVLSPSSIPETVNTESTHWLPQSRHSAPPSTLDGASIDVRSNPASPLRSRFHLSPHFSKSSRRRSPHTSPSKNSKEAISELARRDSRLSPLHKVTGMTFSSLKSSPSRSGSYKVHSSPPRRINRRSLRRARSLKSGRDAHSVSLVSVKPRENHERSIETISIQAKRIDDSRPWQSGREEVTMLQGPDEGNKECDKAMSYSETADKANLPNFSLVKDRLGITKISDLSQVDMRKVQSLALIELTALFDLRGIDLKRKKPPKSKVKETGVFGVLLTTLVEWDQKRLSDSSLKVPLVLKEIISFLEDNALNDEGILRKSGSSARIKVLKQSMELRYGYSNTVQDVVPPSETQMWSEAHPNDVATILKQFLRELPDPLLTTEYIDAFQSCGLISDRKEQLQALNLLIILLNEVHRDSLKLLLKFLERVVSCEHLNKMSLNNVAMITAPNLFMGRKQSKKESSSTSQDLKHAAGTSNIVRMLIKYNKLLWTVPAFMLTQVRHMNRAESSSKKTSSQKEKHKMKFFPGKTKDSQKKLNLSITHQPFDYETPKGVIRVQAPDMIMTSMAVQLDTNLTAGDVIARFQRQCERINPSIEINDSTHALFEVGGNINERCLDPDTNMSALMRVNPDTSWFIKPRI